MPYFFKANSGYFSGLQVAYKFLFTGNMTNSKKTIQGWLDVGYKIFAHEGPEGIQVERLARILGVNKSGFYHFFVV
jgi:hypothetical protein